MIALLLSLALAAEPSWVQILQPPLTNGPPPDTCASSPTIENPGAPPPESTGTGSSTTEPPWSTGMVRVEMPSSAVNDSLPAEIKARATVPVDLAALPVEPLRGNPADIARVQGVFANARQRSVRLAFWGASHVAGEYFTGEIRRILQDKYGDLGHGFIMPAAPWKGYRATDVNLCSGGTWVSDFDNRVGGRRDGLLGPGGMSVEGLDASTFGWVQTTRENPHGRNVSRFEVLFLRQPNGGTLSLQVDDGAPLTLKTAAAATGPGAVVLPVPDGPHRLTVRPVGDGPVRLFGVNMEREGPGIIVDAMGVNGRTASSWLRWDGALMGTYLDRRPPDLAVLAYGTNEANDLSLNAESYRQTLDKVLSKMRTLLPDTPCVLIGPGDRGKKVRGTTYAIWSHTAWVAQVQQELGPRYGCATWDLQAAMGGPGSVFGWRLIDPPLMAEDLIHYSVAGYKELARRFTGLINP